MAGIKTEKGYAFALGWPEEDYISEILALVPEFKINKSQRVEIPIKGKIIFDFEQERVTVDVESDQ